MAGEKVGLKRFANKVISKQVNFMGDKVEIRKLSLEEVMAIQDLAKANAAKSVEDQSPEDQFGMLRHILRIGVIGGEDLEDDEFMSLPLQEITALSEELMKYAGVGEQVGKP